MIEKSAKKASKKCLKCKHRVSFKDDFNKDATKYVAHAKKCAKNEQKRDNCWSET